MLAYGDNVQEHLGAPSGAWTATIISDPTITDLTFNGGQARLRLSAKDRARLTSPDCEGVYFQTEGTPTLRYFIEKDFPCAHPRAADALEPETETFMAPVDFAARKQ